MLHPIIANEIGKTRYKEMMKEAENYRRARKFYTGRTFSLPQMSLLFTNRKSEEKTVTTLHRLAEKS